MSESEGNVWARPFGGPDTYKQSSRKTGKVTFAEVTREKSGEFGHGFEKTGPFEQGKTIAGRCWGFHVGKKIAGRS